MLVVINDFSFVFILCMVGLSVLGFLEKFCECRCGVVNGWLVLCLIMMVIVIKFDDKMSCLFRVILLMLLVIKLLMNILFIGIVLEILVLLVIRLMLILFLVNRIDFCGMLVLVVSLVLVCSIC